MSWLLPRLRPGSALRLGAGRHAVQGLSNSAEALAWSSSVQGAHAGRAPHASQPLRCLADGSQAIKPAASPEEESRLRKARWRQWADEQLQQQERPQGGGPAAPPMPPPASADNMSPEVAAAVQRQQPFIRRQPDAAEQSAGAPDAAQPASTGSAQPQSVVHVPAEAAMAAADAEAATDLTALADAAAAAGLASEPAARATIAQRLGLQGLASNAAERAALRTARLQEAGTEAEAEGQFPAGDADADFAAAAQQAAAEQVAMAEAQVEANPEGVGAALERREELLAGGSTPEAAEAVGLVDAAVDVAAAGAAPEPPQPDAAAAQPARQSAGSTAEGALGMQALQPRQPQQQQQQPQPQRGLRQQPPSAAWDAFVAAQAAPSPLQANQPPAQQPPEPAPPVAEASADRPASWRRFLDHATLERGPGPDPRTGYAALAQRGAEAAPVPHAPPRLHPTRDFFPGQFYRPADLNPFVPAETSQFSAASRRIEQPRPTASEAVQGADFRNVAFLARFVTDTGRIMPRRRSGLQAKVYRRIARSIKTAKHMALAPIDTRPPLTPQGGLQQPRQSRGPPPQGGQQRGASGYGATAPPASTAAPKAEVSTGDEDAV